MTVLRCSWEHSDFTSLDGQNRQSPIVGLQRTWSTLASHSAVPRGTNVTRMNTNRARFESQRKARRVYEHHFLCFGGGGMTTTNAS